MNVTHEEGYEEQPFYPESWRMAAWPKIYNRGKIAT